MDTAGFASKGFLLNLQRTKTAPQKNAYLRQDICFAAPKDVTNMGGDGTYRAATHTNKKGARIKRRNQKFRPARANESAALDKQRGRALRNATDASCKPYAGSCNF